jgi:hypothetical protein
MRQVSVKRHRDVNFRKLASHSEFEQRWFTLGYLDAEVEACLAARAKARGVEVGQLLDELLRKDIELIETAR